MQRWLVLLIPQIKEIIASFFNVSVREVQPDLRAFKDYGTIFKVGETTIICRVRKVNRFMDSERYKREFTLCAERLHRLQAEYPRIVKGWGQYLLYGFAEDNRVDYWWWGSLDVFRDWHDDLKSLNHQPHKAQFKAVKSLFNVYELKTFPQAFILTSSHSRKQLQFL